MKWTLFAIVVLSVVSVVFSALAFQPKDPTKPGHCYSDTTGPMKNQESKPLKGCGVASCQSDGTLVFETCGVIVGRPTKPDLSKPYPDCC
ncbi:hypothetical protein GWI33_007286 [Rhynchophorus ferrugineus]|uniref:Single domain-containing protein n=1 Tax=Rhynchophorus ferrugineus TaxID=354439 RepID=A0A834IKI7_RHYFE|nr:hypothetical protein GWI33_007286 [Rhynchophorus ferrugineus]